MAQATFENQDRRGLDTAIIMLNDCIEAATDAQRGYAAASADVRDPALKKLFQLRSDEREEFVVALQRCVAELGSRPENQGSIEGALHRAWLAARLAVDGPIEYIVLLECERGERAGLGTYEQALHLISASPKVSEHVKKTLREQISSIRSALDDLGKRIAEHARA